MEFRKLDMGTWKRGEIFRHFIDDVRCVIAVTAEVDVTALRALCRSRGLRFYPAYLYVISRAVNRQEALRMGWDAAGNPGIWDEVWPSYVVFHPEDARSLTVLTGFMRRPCRPWSRMPACADLALRRCRPTCSMCPSYPGCPTRP